MSESKQFKLVIAYDGTDFSGWQIQKNGLSVANYVERAFKAIFKKEIHLIGASRTDAGVHAFGQVATFFTDISVTSCRIQRALQEAMPASIFIRSCQEVSTSFHPRFDVVSKVYHYTLYLEKPLPWQARYGYFHEDHSYDLELLRAALQIFVGTHDFRSFCTGNEYASTLRMIESIDLVQTSATSVMFIFKARGFLRYMIRRIVGACLDVASKKMAFESLQHALLQKNPNQQFMIAPPQGLMLYEIFYS